MDTAISPAASVSEESAITVLFLTLSITSDNEFISEFSTFNFVFVSNFTL